MSWASYTKANPPGKKKSACHLYWTCNLEHLQWYVIIHIGCTMCNVDTVWCRAGHVVTLLNKWQTSDVWFVLEGFLNFNVKGCSQTCSCSASWTNLTPYSSNLATFCSHCSNQQHGTPYTPIPLLRIRNSFSFTVWLRRAIKPPWVPRFTHTQFKPGSCQV